MEIREAQRITRGGFGGFELAIRGLAIAPDVGGLRGGIARDVTAGSSWYPDTKGWIVADDIRSHTARSELAGGRGIDATPSSGASDPHGDRTDAI